MQIAVDPTMFKSLLSTVHLGHSGHLSQSLANRPESSAQFKRSLARSMSPETGVGATNALAGAPGGESASGARQLF